MTPTHGSNPAPGPPGDGWRDDYLDDFDPSDPNDIWAMYLGLPEVIESGREHIQRCYDLDPSKHS